MRKMLSISIGETVKTGSALPAGSLDSGDFVQAPSSTDSVRIVPARIGSLRCFISPYPCDPAKILLLLLKKPRRGFHDARPQSRALALGIFGSEVFEVRHAKGAAQRVDVEIHVPAPLIVKRAEQKRPDRASLGATEPLQFPDVRQEILELFG